MKTKSESQAGEKSIGTDRDRQADVPIWKCNTINVTASQESNTCAERLLQNGIQAI